MFNVFIQILQYMQSCINCSCYVIRSNVSYYVSCWRYPKGNCMLSRDRASKRNLNHKEVSLNENMQHNMTHVVVVETTKMISVVGLSCRHNAYYYVWDPLGLS